MIDRLWPAHMQFATPWALVLLAIPLGLLVLELFALRPRGARLSALPAMGAIPPSLRTRLLWVPPVARFIGLGLLVIALAQSADRAGTRRDFDGGRGDPDLRRPIAVDA